MFSKRRIRRNESIACKSVHIYERKCIHECRYIYVLSIVYRHVLYTPGAYTCIGTVLDNDAQKTCTFWGMVGCSIMSIHPKKIVPKYALCSKTDFWADEFFFVIFIYWDMIDFWLHYIHYEGSLAIKKKVVLLVPAVPSHNRRAWKWIDLQIRNSECWEAGCRA